jgi:putative membrane protein
MRTMPGTIAAPAEGLGCVRSAAVTSFIIRLLVNGFALWVATQIVDGVTISSDSTSSEILTLLVVALIFGLVNAFIKPVVQLLSLPLLVLTLGLFTLIVNALMFWLTSGIADVLDLPFHVDGFFWEAVLGALVVSFVSWILNLLLPD